MIKNLRHNAEAIQFMHPKYVWFNNFTLKSTEFHGNLKFKCIFLVDLTWNYPLAKSKMVGHFYILSDIIQTKLCSVQFTNNVDSVYVCGYVFLKVYL